MFFDMMSLERVDRRQRQGQDLPDADRYRARPACSSGSDESAAYNGHDFEVTHGMTVRKEARSTYLSRPTMRSMDGAGLAVLIAAGDGWQEALEIANIQIACGARVLLGLTRQADVAVAQARAKAEGADDRLTIVRFNRTEPAAMEAALDAYTQAHRPITGAIFMPALGPGELVGNLVDASDEDIGRSWMSSWRASIALARTLSRYWKRNDRSAAGAALRFPDQPERRPGRCLWANAARGDRGTDPHLARRIARLMSRTDGGGRPNGATRSSAFRIPKPENTRFTAGHAARILLKESKIREVTLYIPTSIGEATGSRKAMLGFSENITGLHLGKVALITGGSAGIGGQVARLLALAGAKVMMVARRESELAVARARIVSELEDIGFAGVERRVQTLANVDVSDFETLKAAVDATIKAFGRIDYLINNAGVAGAEDMVVDMSVDAWNYTLDANLISNYYLMHHVVPLMKRQGSGYVLNVSSLFRRREISGGRLSQPRRLCRVEIGSARHGRNHVALSRAGSADSTPSRRGRSTATGWRDRAASPGCSNAAAG